MNLEKDVYEAKVELTMNMLNDMYNEILQDIIYRNDIEDDLKALQDKPDINAQCINLFKGLLGDKVIDWYNRGLLNIEQYLFALNNVDRFVFEHVDKNVSERLFLDDEQNQDMIDENIREDNPNISPETRQESDNLTDYEMRIAKLLEDILKDFIRD